jgi:hypothetical protein
MEKTVKRLYSVKDNICKNPAQFKHENKNSRCAQAMVKKILHYVSNSMS